MLEIKICITAVPPGAASLALQKERVIAQDNEPMTEARGAPGAQRTGPRARLRKPVRAGQKPGGVNRRWVGR